MLRIMKGGDKMENKINYVEPRIEEIELNVEPTSMGAEQSSTCGYRSCCYGGDESSNGW